MSDPAPGMADSAATRREPQNSKAGAGRQRLAAIGGLLGAVAASSCCIVPLLLFSVGAGGVWIGNHTALAPYQPVFIAITAGFLAYGYSLIYRKPSAACADEPACARPVSGRTVKAALWVSTALTGAAIGFPWYAPLLLES